jgi:hypothetical protein
MNLTKSDFKIARTCPTKLYYKKLRYPSLNDDNPYLEFLADGGYMVEKMAKLLFPDGRELKDWENSEQAFKETSLALETGDGTLFEATVLHKTLLARIDILCRESDTLKLIEVKSSSIDSDTDGSNPFRGKKGGISSEWLPYLEDVTFQTIVLRRAFPQFKVVPFLCVVDKAKSATANVTFDKFRLRRADDWRTSVDYLGDVEKLRKEHVLVIVDVSGEVEELKAEVEIAADKFAATLQSNPIGKIAPEIGKKCKSCEYRLPREITVKNGFRECWGTLADPEPHALDLYRVDLVGGKNRDAVAELAAKGLARLADMPLELLSGVSAVRQHLQLECTAAGREHVDPGLKNLLSSHPYPLQFIDFEGSRLAIPYHEGMHPYEQASFQWSCHTIRAPGAEIEHSEWLNTDDAFPNFEFARTLKNRIGNEGTVYIWSHYEVAILREIREQMAKYGKEEPDLAKWLDAMIADGNPRIVDLCALAKDHYFHPAMKGSLSIKYVLPAVWKTDANVRSNPLLQGYVRSDEQGNLLNPYATLPSLPIGNEEEVVKEGTGAMRVYQEMMFGRARLDASVRENYRKLLLQYCKLDTAAMVAIWMHWVNAGARTTGSATK